MRSTVRAGSSRSVSRVPGPPPRTSIDGDRRLVEHDRGHAGGEPRVLGVADPDAGDIGDEVAPATLVRSAWLRRQTDCMSPSRQRSDAPSLRRHSAPVRPEQCIRSRPRGSPVACALARAHQSADADITIAAALFAGLLSFLSPCVLPLVPPYLVYLAGASLERFADAEPEPRVRRETVAGGAAVRRRLLHRVRRARRERERDRRVGARLFGRARIVAGIVIIVMGLHFLGITPHRLLMREKRARSREAGRPVGRLCDGARLCVRLDALHRADPRRDPRGRRVEGDGRQGRRPARGLFRRPRHAVLCRRLRGRAVRRFPRPLPRHLDLVEKVMGGLWC